MKQWIVAAGAELRRLLDRNDAAIRIHRSERDSEQAQHPDLD
jgi:hypothetical protein